LERNHLKNVVDPAIEKAKKDFATACGCNWSISFDRAVAEKQGLDKLSALVNMAEKISEEAPGYCDDADSKKTACKVSKIIFAYGPELALRVEKDTATFVTDGGAIKTFDMLMTELDK